MSKKEVYHYVFENTFAGDEEHWPFKSTKKLEELPPAEEIAEMLGVEIDQDHEDPFSDWGVRSCEPADLDALIEQAAEQGHEGESGPRM